MSEVKYKGVVLKPIKKAKTYAAPVKMLVWDEGDSRPSVAEVVAILDPAKANRRRVVTASGVHFDCACVFPHIEPVQATYLQLIKRSYKYVGILDTTTGIISSYVSCKKDEILKQVPTTLKLVVLPEDDSDSTDIKYLDVTIENLGLYDD